MLNLKVRSDVACVECVFSYRRDVRLVRSAVVVVHEGVELQRVELEAGVVDVRHILHGVFVHGQQGGGLEGTTNTSISFSSFISDTC